jgi:hypothetical protein
VDSEASEGKKREPQKGAALDLKLSDHRCQEAQLHEKEHKPDRLRASQSLDEAP